MTGCLRDRVEVDDLMAVLVFVRRGIGWDRADGGELRERREKGKRVARVAVSGSQQAAAHEPSLGGLARSFLQQYFPTVARDPIIFLSLPVLFARSRISRSGSADTHNRIGPAVSGFSAALQLHSSCTAVPAPHATPAIFASDRMLISCGIQRRSSQSSNQP